MLRQKNWALLSVGIHGLRDFSEKYGFVATDDVVRAVALMLKNIVQESGAVDPFIGHLGEADFIIICAPSQVSALRERIGTRLNQSTDYFYPVQDREDKSQTSRISFGIGVVTPQDGPFGTPLEIKVAALKAQA